jgi:hypothetical protein
MIQQLVDDVWQDRAVLRTAVSLRAYLKTHAGRVGAGVPAILAALPERVDIRARDPRR